MQGSVRNASHILYTVWLSLIMATRSSNCNLSIKCILTKMILLNRKGERRLKGQENTRLSGMWIWPMVVQPPVCERFNCGREEREFVTVLSDLLVSCAVLWFAWVQVSKRLNTHQVFNHGAKCQGSNGKSKYHQSASIYPVLQVGSAGSYSPIVTENKCLCDQPDLVYPIKLPYTLSLCGAFVLKRTTLWVWTWVS